MKFGVLKKKFYYMEATTTNNLKKRDRGEIGKNEANEV
jgi:hypothetical protein